MQFYLFFILWKDAGAALNMDSHGAGDHLVHPLCFIGKNLRLSRVSYLVQSYTST